MGKNKLHDELFRFTISPLFMIIAYSTGRPIIIPHSTVGARHFSFSHKLESNYNIDSAIHYERDVVNNILCSRRSLNKISVCIDVCFSSFFSREAIALYRRRSGLPTAPTNDVYWLIIKFTSFCPRLCYASDVEPKEGRIKRIRKRVSYWFHSWRTRNICLPLSLSLSLVLFHQAVGSRRKQAGETYRSAGDLPSHENINFLRGEGENMGGNQKILFSLFVHVSLRFSFAENR